VPSRRQRDLERYRHSHGQPAPAIKAPTHATTLTRRKGVSNCRKLLLNVPASAEMYLSVLLLARHLPVRRLARKVDRHHRKTGPAACEAARCTGGRSALYTYR
jgi:hypothetical protein